MNFINKNWHRIVLLTYVFIMPIVSFAADDNTPPGPTVTKLVNPLAGNGDVPTLIRQILEGLLQIGIPVVALAVVYCGFLFVFARGNSEKLTKAKDALLYTLIGAAILLGSWALATMISGTVNAL